jgi:lysophospholipase L1-like esterase
VPTLKVTEIMAFGDSMTEGERTQALWGFHDPSTPGVVESYPYKLWATTRDIYTSQTINVYNLGKGGEKVTQSDTKARFEDAVDHFDPDLILLMHGANDLINLTDRAVIVDAIEELIDQARADGIPVMLLTLPRQVEGRSKTTLVPEEVPRLNAALKELAEDEGLVLVDIYPYITEALISGDGLHPNEAGNAKIAELVYKAIKAKYHVPPK